MNNELYQKHCPDCKKLQNYSSKYKLLRALKNNSRCDECSRKRPSKKRQNLTGNIYGRLTVVSFYEKRKGQQYWKCKCNCGNETIVGHTHLTLQRVRSCGCSHFYLKNKHPHWTGIGDMPGTYMGSLRQSAKKRKLEFNLTKEQLWKLFLNQNRKCILSGVELSFNSQHNKNDGTASLDRIDSSKGYTIDNVQWVHKIVNIMKHDVEEKEFFNWCKLITERNKL
jgi:hypothetical protein